jgi:hypothetical protein
MGSKAFRDSHFRDRNRLQAEGLVAAGAVEMDVEIVVVGVVVAVTEFVADTFSRILQRVNETAAVEKLQCPENV